MANMVGCDDWMSKAYMDNKFADLSRVYPTEDLADLFQEFPRGFTIHHARDAYYKGRPVTIRIGLSGDPYEKEISGTVGVYEVAQDNTEKELFKTRMRYQSGKYMLQQSNEALQSLLADVHFVFQRVSLTKQLFEQATMTKYRKDHPEIYGASYVVTSTDLQHYFGSPKAQFTVILIGNKKYDDDSVFFRRIHVGPRNGSGMITESIEGLFTEVE